VSEGETRLQQEGGKEETMDAERRAPGQLIAGLILIALGVLFLLDRFYMLEFGRYFAVWWPTLLILLGMVLLVRHEGRRLAGPLVVITLGAIFLVDNLNVFSWWRVHNLWPLILIAVGVGMMIGRLRQRTHTDTTQPPTFEVKS
jgi:hypothetical protein